MHSSEEPQHCLKNSDHNIYNGYRRDFIFNNFPPPFSETISSAGYETLRYH